MELDEAVHESLKFIETVDFRKTNDSVSLFETTVCLPHTRFFLPSSRELAVTDLGITDQISRRSAFSL